MYFQSAFALHVHQERKLGIKHYCSQCTAGPFWSKADLRGHLSVSIGCLALDNTFDRLGYISFGPAFHFTLLYLALL